MISQMLVDILYNFARNYTSQFHNDRFITLLVRIPASTSYQAKHIIHTFALTIFS